MKFYVAPAVELVEVAVEAGFAASPGDGTGTGSGIGGGNEW